MCRGDAIAFIKISDKSFPTMITYRHGMHFAFANSQLTIVEKYFDTASKSNYLPDSELGTCTSWKILETHESKAPLNFKTNDS